MARRPPPAPAAEARPGVDLLRRLRTVAEIAKLLGRHPSAVNRWITSGTLLSDGETRLRLRAVKAPSGWMTSEEWLAEFFEALTCDAQRDVPTPPPARDANRPLPSAHAAAEAACEAVGI
jgi:hypothetical protein